MVLKKPETGLDNRSDVDQASTKHQKASDCSVEEGRNVPGCPTKRGEMQFPTFKVSAISENLESVPEELIVRAALNVTFCGL
jgi:hypothetical protein